VSHPLRALLVEDSEDDALLVTRQLRRHDAHAQIERVASADALREALERPEWDIVICDYDLPGFDGLAALDQVRKHDAELPFIMVSATIDEALAGDAMRTGASDYVMKDNLARLLPAVRRELRETAARRAQQARLHHVAHYDPITGLANRALFVERLALLLGVARRGGRPLAAAAAVIDIDRFGMLNGSLGRPAGDALLAQLGARLGACAADSSHVARVGADQFAVAYPEARSESEIARAVQEVLRRAVGEPFHLNGGDYTVSAKAGIAVFPADGADAETVLAHAESALARAKTGAQAILFYTEGMTTRFSESLVLENRLRQAILNDEFELYYQPKVTLGTRRITGVEALVRWRSPELGLVQPSQFIKALEETGMIAEVGAWALKQAVRDGSHWIGEGAPPTTVAVNVSVEQIHRADFVAVVSEALALGGSPPGIEIEITESVLVRDFDRSVEKLAAVRELGVTIAIDDFGTGYSSLGYLARMPVQSLKIDRSFVTGMSTDPHTRALVATIINMARSLGLKAVAEGVETESQARELQLLGCDEMQGYLIGKPVPRDEMTALLKRTRQAPRLA
jgi:diguanylate cyclase (GGDEF)-like protein